MRNYLIIIITLLFSIQLQAQWPSSTDESLYLGQGVEFLQALPDFHGGTYVLWGTFWINIARIDKDGYILWQETDTFDKNLEHEAQLQNIALSSDSCLIVSYKTFDYEEGTFNAGNAEFRVQKVDSLGNKLWGTGVIVSPPNVTGEDLIIHSVGSKASKNLDGGTYVVWTDKRATTDELTSQLYGQQLNSQGEPLWSPYGILLAENVRNIQFIQTSSNASLYLIVYIQINNSIGEKKLHIVSPFADLLYGTEGLELIEDRLTSFMMSSDDIIYAIKDTGVATIKWT
jgi:hypothetical protein